MIQFSTCVNTKYDSGNGTWFEENQNRPPVRAFEKAYLTTISHEKGNEMREQKRAEKVDSERFVIWKIIKSCKNETNRIGIETVNFCRWSV